MASIDTIFFRLDGLLVVPGLSEACLRVWQSSDPGPLVQEHLRQARQLAQDRERGLLSPDSLCAALAGLSDRSGARAGELLTLALQRIAVDPSLLPLLDELAPRLQLWLLADMPSDTLSQVTGMGSLLQRFPPGQIVVLSEASGDASLAGVLRQAAEAAERQPADCLLIDPSSGRSIAAVRSGFHAIAYLDAPRLRRELALRGLLPEPSPTAVSHAPPGGRPRTASVHSEGSRTA